MSLLQTVKDKLRPSEWMKDLLFTGVGATALSIIYQFFKVLEKQPELLLRWGPNFIFWILGITLGAILVNSLIEAVRESASNFAEGQSENTAAINRLANAQQDLANTQKESNARGSKQLDEIQTGVGYSAAQNEEIMSEQREIRKDFQGLCQKVQDHLDTLRDERLAAQQQEEPEGGIR